MKAILVIDTPKTCAECDCHLWKVCVPADEDIDEYINPSTGKPDWCPLRPLPKVKTREEEIAEDPWNEDLFYDDYIRGWNACLETLEYSQNWEDSNE